MFWCIISFFSPRDEPVYKLHLCGIQYEGEHIQLLQHGVTESASSQYSSLMFDAEIWSPARACCGVLNPNQHTEMEPILLPETHSTSHWFSKAKYLTSPDGNQEYHHILPSEASKSLMTFCTDQNLYQYHRIPFGIVMGAHILVPLLDMILHDIKSHSYIIYMRILNSTLPTFHTFPCLCHTSLMVKLFTIVCAVWEMPTPGHWVSSLGVPIDSHHP
jgi:hypothetical protein